jgi:hypothetical protein
LPGHKVHVSSLCFSPDGRSLATSCWDHTVRVWEVWSGKERYRLEGHTDRVGAVTFAPDGLRLASASDDRTVRLWDLAAGTEARCFRGHLGVVGPLAFAADGKALFSGGWDTTILAWDTGGTPRPAQPRKAGLTPEALESLWADLASADASRAYRAATSLTGVPRQAVSFVKGRLRPDRAPDTRRLDGLLADLDNDRFAVRERAVANLEKLGELAEPALRRALQNRPAAETRRRVERLLERLEAWLPSPDQLRFLRAVEVLEHLDTPEAKQALESLAQGTPAARLTQEARASLKRLDKRSEAAPAAPR